MACSVRDRQRCRQTAAVVAKYSQTVHLSAAEIVAAIVCSAQDHQKVHQMVVAVADLHLVQDSQRDHLLAEAVSKHQTMSQSVVAGTTRILFTLDRNIRDSVEDAPKPKAMITGRNAAQLHPRT